MKRLDIIGVSILLCGLAITDGHAAADIGFKGLGGHLAYVSPSDIDGTIGFGAIVDLGTFTPDIGFQATIDYWSKSEGSGSAEVSFRDLSFGARSIYNFSVKNEKLKPFAGAGLALHLVKVDVPAVTVQGFGTVGGGDTTETKFGLDLAGGVGYEASKRVDLIGEVMYRVVSDVSQFVISAGAIYWFGGE